jgi:dTDP-4-dehydrorhamnose reductase
VLLIIGKESLIGRAISQIADEKHISSVGTSRRLGEQWFVDLSMPSSSWQIPPQATTAIICAACTKLSDCEANPDESRAINVTATVELARRLTAQECRVVFLSTNQVFSPNLSAPPDESTPVSPANEYGRQKAEAEAAILALSPKNIVIRLTKVVSSNDGIFSGWKKKLFVGETIEAYENLYCSPIPLQKVSEKILEIALNDPGGVFHVGSKEAFSYYELGQIFVSLLKIDSSLIKKAKTHLPNNPQSGCLASNKIPAITSSPFL